MSEKKNPPFELAVGGMDLLVGILFVVMSVFMRQQLGETTAGQATMVGLAAAVIGLVFLPIHFLRLKSL